MQQPNSMYAYKSFTWQFDHEHNELHPHISAGYLVFSLLPWSHQCDLDIWSVVCKMLSPPLFWPRQWDLVEVPLWLGRCWGRPCRRYLLGRRLPSLPTRYTSGPQTLQGDESRSEEYLSKEQMKQELTFYYDRTIFPSVIMWPACDKQLRVMMLDSLLLAARKQQGHRRENDSIRYKNNICYIYILIARLYYISTCHGHLIGMPWNKFVW